MTEAEKLVAYREGRYLVPVPPVYTYLWDEAAWIRFIDQSGKWTLTAQNGQDDQGESQ
jgi:hypothetical protein